MKVLKEWHGAFQSTIYLKECDGADGSKFLLLFYGYSLIGGNRYEGSETYSINDLQKEEGELINLLNSDFPQHTLQSIISCVEDYKSGKEIDRWN